MKILAELRITKLEDRKLVAGILLENGYSIGSSKRKKTETGKAVDYFLKIYEEENPDE